MTNIVLTALIMVNGANVGQRQFEVVPDEKQVIFETCKACRNGWAPLEAPCTCKTKWVQTGKWHLEPFEPEQKDRIGVVTNYVPVSSFDMLHHTVGKRFPDVKMDEPVYIRVVEKVEVPK